MTLFTMLLVMIAERLFKLGEHWHLDHRLEVLFRRIRHFSMLRPLLMTAGVMVITFLLLRSLYGLFFNVPLLVVWILLGVLCIGAGKVRLHYHAYLKAASRDDVHARGAMASELTMIHGVPPDCDEREFLRELQNALLWINFRYYLAPLFWFVVGGPWGPVLLMGYAFLRAWQTWLARYLTPHERLQSGIDAILHVLDWLPVRLVGVVYALIGHGEKALPAWFASLADRHTAQYQVLTRLAQFSLAREPHTNKVETPKAAVSMAKKTSFVVVVIVALLTIYGTLVCPSAPKPLQRIRRRDAEIRHPVVVPADELQASVAIRIVKRIAFNFSVVSRVVDQHIVAFRRLRKAVMAWSILTVFVAGDEHRARGFMPVSRVLRIGIYVYPQ